MLSDFLLFLLFEIKRTYLSTLSSAYLRDIPERLSDNSGYSKLPDWYKKELEVIEFSKRKYENKKLYLVSFNEGLSTLEAKKKIHELGLRPADMIETVLYFLNFNNQIDKNYPIIAIDANNNYSKFLGEVSLSIDILNSREIEKPGEIEASEKLAGAKFYRGVKFLVAQP